MKRIRMTNIKKLRIISDTRGSALVAVFMIIIIMLIFAMGIMALSVANTKQAKVDDTFERDYFVAEGGAKQGIEAIQSAVLEQYRSIAAEMKNGVESNNNATSFFSVIDAVTYTPPQPDSSTGGPSSNTLTFTHSTVNSTTHSYTILSNATDGKTPRNVVGTLTVTFVPVTKTIIAFTPLGDETVLAGGLFDSSAGNVNITGKPQDPAKMKVGDLKYKQWNFNFNGDSNPPAATLASLEDPTLASRLIWKMKYPGFTKEAKSSVTLTLPALANGTNITNGSFSGAPFNWTVPSPIYLEGQSGASFSIDSSIGTYNGGQIYCTGNLTDSAPIIGTSGSYVKIYANNFTQGTGQLNYVKVFADGNINLNNGPAVSNSYIYSHGDISISGRDMSNLTIICDGNLTVNGGSSTNVTIYCKGTFNDSANTRTKMKVYCNSYKMSGGNIVGDSIVYAETYMHLESTCSGLFYTNGNIDLSNGGSGITGQIAAKGNIVTTGYSFTKDSAMIARLNVDPFVSSSPHDSCITIVQPISSLVFTGAPTFGES